jgi:poly [ADP-ribose] polymerase
MRKGYHDVSVTDTLVRLGNTPGGPDFSSLKPKIKKLLEDLNRYADKTIQMNYQDEALSVSETLVKKAQEYIDAINGKVKLNANSIEINDMLIKLYRVIPRKMKRVQDYLLNDPLDTQKRVDDFQDKMTIEQGLLDVLVSKLDSHKNALASANAPTTGNTVLGILDELGLEVEEVTAAEEKMLKDMMSHGTHDISDKYIEAFKVINKKTQKLFDEEVAKSKNKTTKLLFHGSKRENWLSIIKSGLQLHPNARTTGKLFDNGIYFADEADKALGYIDGGRWNNSTRGDSWMAVYDVHVGKMMTYNELIPLERNGRIYLHDYVPANGYDSFYAERDKSGGRYHLYRSEYMVYKEEKCTIQYLIYINT